MSVGRVSYHPGDLRRKLHGLAQDPAIQNDNIVDSSLQVSESPSARFQESAGTGEDKMSRYSSLIPAYIRAFECPSEDW